MEYKKLRGLFCPKSAALVGATDREGAFGWFAAKWLKISNLDRFYFINNKKETVQGVRAYPSLDTLPEIPEVVLIATPAAVVNGILRQAGELGIHNAIVFSSGFSEDRRHGQALEDEMMEIARQYDMKIVGPNGIGILNNVDHVQLWGNSGNMSEKPCTSGVAVLAHSGGYTQEMFARPYIDLAYAVSVGNGNVVTIEEEAEYCINDPAVTAVGMYVEGFKKPDVVYRLFARAAELKKPIIILKSGRSVKGAISAASHTGNLAGSNEVFEALFEKYGIIRADTVEEFYGLLQICGVMGSDFPEGTGFAIINRSGGETTMCADLAERFGVNLPDLSEETKQKLSDVLPQFATAKNPLDLTADALGDKNILRNVIEAIASDENVHAIGAGFPFEENVDPNVVFDINAFQGDPVIAYRQTQGAKPMFMIPQFEAKRSAEWRYKLKAVHVPILPPGEMAYSILGKFSAWLNYRPEEHRLEWAIPTGTPAGITLSEYESKQALSSFGIDIPEQRIVRNHDELLSACEAIGFPMVIKINSRDIPHKTEAGGVKLNIVSHEQAVLAYDDIMRACSAFAPNAVLDGALVQKQSAPGQEVILGVKNDRQFGPMLLVGMGGVFVEVFKDAVLTPCPLSTSEALAQLNKLKAIQLLKGYRGSAPCDLESLAHLMVQVSEYAVANKDNLSEMDINPVFVYPEGKGVSIADALIIQ